MQLEVILAGAAIGCSELIGLCPSMGVLAAGENFLVYTLALGLCGILTGFLLLFAHKQSFDAAMRAEDNERVRSFEARKYRRRSVVSSMVASTGCMMAALYWVTEPKTFVVFILLILTLLLGILVIAFIDLFSVGLHTITKTDDAARKAMVEEYLRQRKKSAFDDPKEN
jgi:hypothetical protein